MRRAAPVAIICACGVLGGAYFALMSTSGSRTARPPVAKPILSGDQFYASQPAKAKSEYESFVENNRSSADKKVQDKVGQARMKLAYLTAKSEGFAAARTVFKTTEAEYKGEGLMNADFGGIKDNAAYQAAVCLIAEGKKKEAEAELRDFIRNYPLSPMVHVAHRRLKRLNGETTPEDDVLLQKAVEAQEKKIRVETAMCGPRCIVKMLELLGKPAKDYKEIAKLCGTTEKGTTLKGMRQGLLAVGLPMFGFTVNRRDFENIPLPALLLAQDHYVVITKITSTVADVFDPTLDRMDQVRLPAIDTPEFTATVLLTSAPETKN